MNTFFLSRFPVWMVAQEGVSAPQNTMMSTFVMLAIAMLLFYFLLWRPDQKRRKAVEQLRASLKKGDRVTAMGILGVVSRIQDNTVILRMVDGAKIEVLKAAITDVQPGTATEDKEAVTLSKEEKQDS